MLRDARHPGFAPWAETAARVAARACAGDALHDALNAEHGAAVHFVPQAVMPAGKSYEHYIFETRQCPVRQGWHDFFNGICWLGLPLAKQQLNRVQAAEIAVRGGSAARGPVRDAITIFDENGAVLSAPQPLWDAMAARDWQRLFVKLRPLWSDARLLVFGHALLEKLVAPRKNVTAHVWAVSAPSAPLTEVDAWLASQLTPERLAAKPFLPLPVMGVPGWCPENAAFSFYDDPLVFRPPS